MAHLISRYAKIKRVFVLALLGMSLLIVPKKRNVLHGETSRHSSYSTKRIQEVNERTLFTLRRRHNFNIFDHKEPIDSS